MTKHRDQRLPSRHCDEHERYNAACDPCREARRAYDRRRDHLFGYGTPSLVSAIGVRRRLSALMTLGWPLSWLAADLGFTQQGMSELFRNQESTTRKTDEMVKELYDRLWNVLPVGRTPAERMAISRTKARALLLGYEPPLAWDDGELDLPLELAVA